MIEIVDDIESKSVVFFKCVSFSEKTLIFTVLSVLLILRISISFHLNRIGVFDQYNVFFDADPNQYVSATANGWGFARQVHPAFALLLNVPVRALDYVAAHLGLIHANAIRNIAPLILSPLLALVGGIYWWLAARHSGFSAPARIFGLLFSQLAFSQTVFSVLPESYAVSGALLSVLLYLSVRAIQDPLSLDTARRRMQWLVLACLMSGVTITNGLLCILVWGSIRFRRGLGRIVGMECLVAVLVLFLSIVAMSVADHLVYSMGSENGKPAQSRMQDIESFTLRYISRTNISRTGTMPGYFLASVFPAEVNTIPNELAGTKKYRYEFSLERYAKSPLIFCAAWLISAMSFFYFFNVEQIPKIIQVIFAVLLFNGLLHSFFGREIFLYSQHWISFLTFGIIFPFGNKVSWRSNALLLAIVLLTLMLSVYAWLGMLSMLGSSVSPTSGAALM